jgi:dihydroorotate dehydrogenase
MRLLEWTDKCPSVQSLLSTIQRHLFSDELATKVGGVALKSPLILAAGFVKGHGFAAEIDALNAVARGDNIIPGWRSVPRLVGPVEFGSFTRWPRMGNPGTVLWRDEASRSTQNRIGLRNPGAVAAATFLAARREALPEQFGVNIAVSPGVDDPEQEMEEVLASVEAFLTRGVYPAWLTLNLSCPNTEDDPGGHQTEAKTRRLCGAIVDTLRQATQGSGRAVPLWVKIGPDLADTQYCVLMKTFAEVGVSAVVATNTLPQPVSGDSEVLAGVGGGRLHQKAVDVAALLVQEKKARGYPVDVVGCGGVQDGPTFQDFARLGVAAVQYWSALVYRGPLAAALVAREALS